MKLRQTGTSQHSVLCPFLGVRVYFPVAHAAPVWCHGSGLCPSCTSLLGGHSELLTSGIGRTWGR